jgi:hypothetical protein
MTKRLALGALLASTLLIAVAYASAFLPGGTPAWAPWCMAMGIPGVLAGVMVLGAVRDGAGLGRLAWPLAFVVAALALGFGLALGLPATEAAGAPLYLGLPLRAAIVLYGIGLMPIAVLPVAYALTFSTQTLTAEDVERVRQAGLAWAAARDAARTDAGSRIDASREEPEAELAGTVAP